MFSRLKQKTNDTDKIITMYTPTNVDRLVKTSSDVTVLARNRVDFYRLASDLKYR